MRQRNGEVVELWTEAPARCAAEEGKAENPNMQIYNIEELIYCCCMFISDSYKLYLSL